LTVKTWRALGVLVGRGVEMFELSFDVGDEQTDKQTDTVVA